MHLIAEVGATANGSLKDALALIDAAKDAGLDAIKFQMVSPDLVADPALMYRYTTAHGVREESLQAIFKGMRFTEDDWYLLMARAAERKIQCFATATRLEDITLARQLGMTTLKIGGWDATNLPLIEAARGHGETWVLVDLGPARLTEALAIDALFQPVLGRVAYLFAPHTVPVNLGAIPYLQTVLGRMVGWGSPGREESWDAAAVGLGATVVEKRLTLDRQTDGHHHALALEPDEMAAWVRTMRALGAHVKQHGQGTAESDAKDRSKYFRAIVAATWLPAGTTLTMEDFDYKRPWADGVSPADAHLLVGKTLKRNIDKDERIKWEDV